MNANSKEVFAQFERVDSACKRLSLRTQSRRRIDHELAELRRALLRACPTPKQRFACIGRRLFDAVFGKVYEEER